MSLFSYKALETNGRTVSGEIEARDSARAITLLRRQGYQTLSIAEAAEASWSSRARARNQGKTLTARELEQFTRALSQLVNSGLPLARSLTVLRDTESSSAVRKAAGLILSDLESGHTLSGALDALGKPFDAFYTGLVRAGEATGNIGETLARLSTHAAERNRMHSEILAALLYPIILIVVSVVAVSLLLGFVVPMFETVFADAGPSIPGVTYAVLELSKGFRSYWWLPLLTVLAFIALVFVVAHAPGGRRRVDGWVLRVPVLGALKAKHEVARFASALGILLTENVTIIDALRIVQPMVGNLVFRDVVNRAILDLEAGGGFAQTFLDAPLFPRLAASMIQVGEEAGRLEQALTDVGTYYEQEAEISMKRLVGLIEPVLILFLGATIGSIMVSILLAMLSINELVI